MEPSTPQGLVERFYRDLWNRQDEDVAFRILHPAFRFRASLGPERRGPDGFLAYARSVHAALTDFTCVIDHLVATETEAAARMTFHGIHSGRFFDIDATGRRIEWRGGAFFTTDGRRITELWVLGDVDAVKRQLGAATASDFSVGSD